LLSHGNVESNSLSIHLTTKAPPTKPCRPSPTSLMRPGIIVVSTSTSKVCYIALQQEFQLSYLLLQVSRQLTVIESLILLLISCACCLFICNIHNGLMLVLSDHTDSPSDYPALGSLGRDGIEQFVQNHTCGLTCQALDLNPLPPQTWCSSRCYSGFQFTIYDIVTFLYIFFGSYR
jgi:hypothetical protein